MKRIIIVLLVLALPVALFAQSPMEMGMGGMGPWAQYQFMLEGLRTTQAGPYLSAEIMQIQSEMAQQKVGDLDVAALVSLRERLSVAAQKDNYVRDMGYRSMALPGLGQFSMGDAGGGFGFMTLDLAVFAGTLVGIYYTLPSDLRFDRIDYLHDSFSSISDAWHSHSVVDYLPSFGVFVGGMIVDQIVRHWASSNARSEAKSKIDAGDVKFTPRIGIGFLGFNVAY